MGLRLIHRLLHLLYVNRIRIVLAGCYVVNKSPFLIGIL